MKKLYRKHAGIILTAVWMFSCLAACGGGKENTDVFQESRISGQESSGEETGDLEAAEPESREEEGTSAFQDAAGEEDVVSGRPQMEVYLQDNRLDEWAGANALMQIGYDSLQVNEQDYPELSWSVENYNRESAAKAAAWKDQNLPCGIEAYEAGEFHGYEYGRSVSLKRADGIALSFVTEVSEYTGGVHGGIFYESSTFDAVTGEKLALEDIVTDVTRLPGAVADALMEQSPEGLFEETPTAQVETLFDSEREYYHEPSWTLDYDGLTFYFGDYELGSYSVGRQEAFIAFQAAPDLFKEPYREPAKEFAVSISPYTSQYADLDGDGKPDEIQVYCSAREYEGEAIHVIVNENETAHWSDGWFGEVFFIKLRDGRYYLYVGVDEVDDIHTIHVFSLTGGECRYIGEYNGDLDGSLVFNPEGFKVVSYMETLGTYSGYRLCHIGNDGLPEPDSLFYTVIQYEYEGQTGPRVTAKQPVPVRMVSADGSVAAETEEMPAGTVFYFQRTDDQTFMEMKLEDGRSCRIDVNKSGRSQTVHGIDIYECFDGIVFAG